VGTHCENNATQVTCAKNAATGCLEITGRVTCNEDTNPCTDTVCSGGGCTHVNDDTNTCPVGSCHGGACCTGCWNGADCQPGNTSGACGNAGVLCAVCAGDFECKELGQKMTCSPPPNEWDRALWDTATWQ
jgi:hypothetical protein